MAQTKRKKKFFDIEIPIINKKTNIYAFEFKEINGKYIKYDLTRILRGKGVEMQFKIKINKEDAIAYPISMKIMPYHLKRMARKGTDYVEDSFSTNCINAQIRIKPFLVTRRKVSRAVRNALRNKAKEELIKYSKDKTSQEIFEDVLKNKMQKTLSLILKKIYPLSTCEIRILKIEKELEEKPEKETTKKEEIKIRIAKKEETTPTTE